MTRATWIAAAALACAGCTLLDGRAEVELDPPALPHLKDPFSITIRARGADRATLLVDDRVIEDSAPVGAPVSVSVDDLADGAHRLTARLHAPYAPERTIELFVDRQGPAFGFDPPDGRTVAPDGLTVTVSVDDPSGVFDAEVVSDVGTVERLSDRRWRVAVGSLEEARTASLTFHARDSVGNQTLWGGAHYFAPELAGAFREDHPPVYPPSCVSCPPARGTIATRGSVWASVSQSGHDVPTAVELLADGVKVGESEVSTAGEWYVSWDSAQVADGTHLLELHVPGWWSSVSGPSITTDNTAPVVSGCRVAPQWEGAVPVWGAKVEVILSEPSRLDGVVVRAGDTIRTIASGVAEIRTDLRVPVPATLAIEFPAGSVRDPAGNVAAPAHCELPLATWIRPLGAGPVADAGAPIAAARAAAGEVIVTEPPEIDPFVWIGAQGTAEAGQLRSFAGVHNATPGTEAVDVLVGAGVYGWVAWIERSVGGPGQVYLRSDWRLAPGMVDGPLNLDPTRDAAELAASVGAIAPFLAWSEATPEGGRAVMVRGSGRWGPVSDPTRVAGSPAVGGNWVAFVESDPAGGSALRVTDFGGADIGVPPLNDAPGATAREPTLCFRSSADGPALAWSEGDRVLLRTWSWSVPQGWTPPVIMNADPLRRARAPRLAYAFDDPWIEDAWLVFVQETAAGEEIRVRRWDGTTWKLIDAPVNEGVGGGVASLAIAAQASGPPLTVTWTDGAGGVYVRAYNR